MEFSKSRTEELLDRLREALQDRDSGRALYLLVRELGGDPLTEEVAICEPDSGRPLGFLVPARERHELLTLADFQALDDRRNQAGRPQSKGGRWSR